MDTRGEGIQNVAANVFEIHRQINELEQKSVVRWQEMGQNLVDELRRQADSLETLTKTQ